MTMRFDGPGRALTADGFSRALSRLGCEPAALWAVLRVESKGFGFMADRRPPILFERHIFARLTDGRFTGRAPDVSHPEPGGYLGGTLEYDRLARAMALDEAAALQSASWGLGQVMGFNHAICGHRTVQGFVAAMVGGEDAQLDAMAAFVADKGLGAALKARNWATFARVYNGAGYARNRYDVKLADAWSRTLSNPPDLRLRAAQAALTYLGFWPGAVDGLKGEKTRTALGDFQRARGMAATGIFDDATESALQDAAWPQAATAVPAARPGWLVQIRAMLGR